MRYPNSVGSVGGGARLSARPQPSPRPLPRPGPIGPQPRRAPGRPQREAPRRPPSPSPRPAPRPPLPVPRRSSPVGPRPQWAPQPFERFPKKGIWSRPAVRGLTRLSGPITIIMFGWEAWRWFDGKQPGWYLPAGWNYFPGCDYEPEFAHQLLFNGCIHNQAGVNDAGEPPFILQRAVSGRRRWGAGLYRYNPGSGRGDHVLSYYKDFFPPDPAAAPTETKPTDIPRWMPKEPAKWPSATSGWGPALYPDWQPVSPPFIEEPSTPPLGVPRPPNPGTPQWPDRWNDVPDTVPFPGLEPYEPPVPIRRPDPDGSWEVNPEAAERPDTQVSFNARGQAQVRQQQNKRPRRPPRGTKERKLHLRGAAAALWRGFGPVTEFGDFVDALYEGVPKEAQRDLFFKLRRRPKAIEKMEAIYDNINEIDMQKVIKAYLENQVEDFILGSIGQLEAGANQRNPFGRPLGYGAGFAL